MRVGETGQLVDCSSVAPLVETVSELLADPARCARMGEAGRSWVVQRFDWAVLSEEASRIFGQARHAAHAARGT
jgi:phosphatidylinositol alpha-1,6-mannosyltransferase